MIFSLISLGITLFNTLLNKDFSLGPFFILHTLPSPMMVSLGILFLLSLCFPSFALFYGFQDYVVLPGHAFVIDVGHPCFAWLRWDAEHGEDPRVVVVSCFQDVNYTYRPVVTTSALVIGNSIIVTGDSAITLQTWIIPATFCAPAVFHYSSSHSFSDEFRLGVSFPTLCFLIDNPTGADFTIQLQSKRVNYTESRVEIWTSGFERVNCPKNRCSAKLAGSFIARIVNGHSGLRYSLQGRFRRHEIQTQCGREAIPIWDRNRSFLVPFNTWYEEFECDGMVIAKREGNRVHIWAARAGACVLGAMLLALWVWEIRVQPQVGFEPMEPQGEDPGDTLRDGAEFLESRDP
jgi:hypothetical protein